MHYGLSVKRFHMTKYHTKRLFNPIYEDIYIF